MFRQILILALVSSSAFAADPKPRSKQRDYIHMVGSSTVYPFATMIAEEFGRNTGFRTPVVESTGTGGGFKLFCEGGGYKYPDFVNASRRIKKSEVEKCKENGIKNVNEISIGNDAIIIANSVRGKNYLLTKNEIFLALAKEVPARQGLVSNFYEKWSQINPKLPDTKIAVYGPPPTSGTRDSFVDLVMEKSCLDSPNFISKYPDAETRKKQCSQIRSDGKFVEAGENDNLIIQKLVNNENALGIFGFSFLEENREIIKPVLINGIDPTLSAMLAKKYELIRPLFIYYKVDNVKLIPGMREFIEEVKSENAIGPRGYLLQKGLIPN